LASRLQVSDQKRGRISKPISLEPGRSVILSRGQNEALVLRNGWGGKSAKMAGNLNKWGNFWGDKKTFSPVYHLFSRV
jgi:hypothetical protein